MVLWLLVMWVLAELTRLRCCVWPYEFRLRGHLVDALLVQRLILQSSVVSRIYSAAMVEIGCVMSSSHFLRH